MDQEKVDYFLRELYLELMDIYNPSENSYICVSMTPNNDYHVENGVPTEHDVAFFSAAGASSIIEEVQTRLSDHRVDPYTFACSKNKVLNTIIDVIDLREKVVRNQIMNMINEFKQ